MNQFFSDENNKSFASSTTESAVAAAASLKPKESLPNKCEPISADSGMKTVRISKSFNQHGNLPDASLFYPSTNGDKSTEVLAAPNDSGGGGDPVQSNGNGVVRRLSVTARPGDIFYKVKDVVEGDQSASPQLNDADAEEKEIIIKSNNFSSQSATPIKSIESQPSHGSLGRKTTTWNVKRNQTSSFVETASKPVLTKEEVVAGPVKTINTLPASAEPGSPLFSKELLSIR